jgi:hypothetical protein
MQNCWKITVSYIFTFMWLNSISEYEWFLIGRQKVLHEFNLLLISLWVKFLFVTALPTYFNCAIFSKELLSLCNGFSCVQLTRHQRTVFSVFSSRATSLLESHRASVFFFMVRMSSPNKFTSWAQRRAMGPIQLQSFVAFTALPNDVF